MGHPTLHFIVGSSTPIWTPHLLPWCSLWVSNMTSEPPGIYIIPFIFASFSWWHLWCFNHACLLSCTHVLCLVVPREMPVTSWFTTPWSNVKIYIYSFIPFGPLSLLLLLLYIYNDVELNQLSVNTGPTLHQPSCSFGNDRRWVSSLRWSLFQPIVISTQLSSVAKFEGSRISGWWFGTFFIFHIFGIETSTGFHIFQRGSFTTNQISWRIRTHKNYQTTPHKKSTKMVSSEVLKSSQSGPPKAPKIMDIDRKKT